MQPDDQTIATYDQNAAKFAAQYEGLSAEATWGQLRSLLPTSSGRAALPIQGEVTLDNVFSGLEWRRMRLQQDQQPPEWAGV
jgi:hypothetical protein